MSLKKFARSRRDLIDVNAELLDWVREAEAARAARRGGTREEDEEGEGEEGGNGMTAVRFRLTGRGLVRVDFADEYGDACSLQESSLATRPCIWLGRDEVAGQPARMHLTREQVATLLPLLQHFAETGQILSQGQIVFLDLSPDEDDEQERRREATTNGGPR